MKYALFFTLLCSTSVFAENFDANLLVGKWECESKSFSNDLQSTEKYVIDFKANGTYLEKRIANMKIDNEPITIKMKEMGRWTVSQGIYTLKGVKILDYLSDNPKLDKKLGLEQSVRNDKLIYRHHITELSNDNFHFHDNEDDFHMSDECKRTNKKLVF